MENEVVRKFRKTYRPVSKRADEMIDKLERDRYRHRMGQRIRAQRKLKGLTQMDVAVACGVNKNRISRIENGELYTPKLLLNKIAETLETTSYDLQPRPDCSLCMEEVEPGSQYCFRHGTRGR